MARCTECNEECKVNIVDDGIGPFEAWGRKYNDVRLRYESDCCEAEVEFDPGEDPPRRQRTSHGFR